MADAKFKLNHAGAKELLHSEAVRAHMLALAQRAASAARSAAPVATGAYQKSIHAEVVTTDRVVGRVVADVDYALVIEAKTRTLGRSIDAARES